MSFFFILTCKEVECTFYHFREKFLGTICDIIELKLKGGVILTSSQNLFNKGEVVAIKETGEKVTISKYKYIKQMKRYSYTVKEHPSTFYFEEELKKVL